MNSFLITLTQKEDKRIHSIVNSVVYSALFTEPASTIVSYINTNFLYNRVMYGSTLTHFR
jgi:hypothetical protein